MFHVDNESKQTKPTLLSDNSVVLGAGVCRGADWCCRGSPASNLTSEFDPFRVLSA
jgi:hypothetical protein